MAPKMHLRFRRRAACGAGGRTLTDDPKLVTCERCKHTVKMADAVQAATVSPRSKRGKFSQD